MKKALSFLLALCLSLSLLAGCASSPPADSGTTSTGDTSSTGGEIESIELKFGCTGPEGSFQANSARAFKENLEEISGGKITVQLNLGGALGNTMSHYSQMENGDLDFFMAALDTASGLKDGGDLAVVLVPFLFDDEEHYQKFLHSDIFDTLIGKVEQANGLVMLGDLARQLPRGLSTTNTPVHTVADVKNLKIRVPESTAMTTIWSAWGANPTTLPATEVYSALESGMADGQDNDVNNSSTTLVEVQRYYMELNYIYQDLFLWASAKNLDELNDTQRDWIDQAVSATYDEMYDLVEQNYKEAKERMVAGGMEFVDVDLDSFREATAEAVRQFDGKLYSAGLYDQIRALADD